MTNTNDVLTAEKAESATNDVAKDVAELSAQIYNASTRDKLMGVASKIFDYTAGLTQVEFECVAIFEKHHNNNTVREVENFRANAHKYAREYAYNEYVLRLRSSVETEIHRKNAEWDIEDVKLNVEDALAAMISFRNAQDTVYDRGDYNVCAFFNREAFLTENTQQLIVTEIDNDTDDNTDNTPSINTAQKKNVNWCKYHRKKIDELNKSVNNKQHDLNDAFIELREAMRVTIDKHEALPELYAAMNEEEMTPRSETVTNLFDELRETYKVAKKAAQKMRDLTDEVNRETSHIYLEMQNFIDDSNDLPYE